uniref:CHAP domain-containing protein n=1 Tax=Herbidospora sakaeratensis TaxID=564415 RepID=UPI000783A584|nr:CHAP domain-containing protein [Herbidospora sakaeratensis]
MQKLITLLRKEIGYQEQSGGYTKFGDWYNAVETDADYSYQPWCDMFLSWGANKLGYSDWFGEFSYTVAHAQWFQAQGAWGHEAKPGAVVFFDWNGGGSIDGIDHVGLVTKVNGSQFTSIEGNTSNMVRERTHDEGTVVGFGYPEQILEKTAGPAETGADTTTDTTTGTGPDTETGTEAGTETGTETRPGMGPHPRPWDRPDTRSGGGFEDKPGIGFDGRPGHGKGSDTESGPTSGTDSGTESGQTSGADSGTESGPDTAAKTGPSTAPGADTGSDARNGSDAGADTPDAKTGTHAGAGTGPRTDTGSHTETGTDTGPGVDRGSDTKTGTGTGPGVDRGSDTESGARTGRGSHDGADTGSNARDGSDTSAGTNPEAGTDTTADTNPGAGTGTTAETNPGAGTDSDAETGARTGADTGTGSHTMPKFGIGSRPGDRPDTRSGGGSEDGHGFRDTWSGPGPQHVWSGIGADVTPGISSDSGSLAGVGPGGCTGSDENGCPDRGPLVWADTPPATSEEALTAPATPRGPTPKVILLKEMAAESPLVHPQISALPVAASRPAPSSVPHALSAQGLVAPLLVVLLALAFLASHRRPASSASKDYLGRHRR